MENPAEGGSVALGDVGLIAGQVIPALLDVCADSVHGILYCIDRIINQPLDEEVPHSGILEL